MTLDRTNQVATAIASALLVGGAVGFYLVRPGGITGAVSFFLSLVLVVCWAFGPRAIVVAEGELRVERRATAPFSVPVARITDATTLPSIGPGTVRVFGVGGLFGSYGIFWNKSIGRFRVYATRRAPVVVLRISGGDLPVVVTPDDADGLLAALGRHGPPQ
jgi:hypothetical protein